MLIHLGAHSRCEHLGSCATFALDLHGTLAGGRYDFPASTLRLDDIDAYLAAHRTARKRATRAQGLGYRFDLISRADHADDVHAINTSTPERQGRPMTAGYRERQQFAPLPEYGCPRHRITEYGVFRRSELVAYLVLYVCGDLAMISQILGHYDHLKSDIMYLLVQGAFRDTLERSGPVVAFYNRWDSGSEGLRYFKERLGFQPARVEWAL